jgi:hypothetical protein
VFDDPVDVGRALVRAGTRYAPSEGRGADLSDARARWETARARMSS